MKKKDINAKADQKIIFHIDVNSAFLSRSAVKMHREEPGSVDLRTIPSVVGGDPKSRHGIVTAKSVPAKKYGIHTADTIASAIQKCPDLVIVPSDFQTYRAYSHAFLDILRSYTPLVEQASIDEAYMDATDLCQKDVQAALELAAGIRQRIREELGFTVNVGISTNRLLAKMASDFEKPDRTHTLFPEEVEKKMWPLPIGDLYGCGGRTSARLRTLGIRTIGEAAKTPVEILIDNLGEKSGKYIHRAANGRGSAGITMVREDAKSYSNEYTTSSDITQETYEAEYLPLLQHLCDKVAGRLQRDGVFGKTVVVTVKTDDFRRRSAQCRLPDATDRPEILYQTAVSLSDKLLLGEHGLFAEGIGIRLVGAGVTDLDHGDFRQMSLLDWEPEEEPAIGDVVSGGKSALEDRPVGMEPDSENAPEQGRPADRAARLQEMEAKINKKYGKGTVSRGMT
ncbi:MAG: DNA polymerase IV [Eubacteriales bacterium]|nr:DNA polymerase IV [Eubacteriales bacterium]